MTEQFTRRSVVSSASLLLGTLAGCSSFETDQRVIGISVINHTDQYLHGHLKLYKEDELFAEQVIDLPGDHPDGSNTSVDTQITLNELSRNTELTAQVTINETNTETIDFTIDCDLDDWAGDGVSFRVYEEYIDANSGCAREEIQ